MRFALAIAIAIGWGSAVHAEDDIIFLRTPRLLEACGQVKDRPFTKEDDLAAAITAGGCTSFIYGFIGAYQFVETPEICLPGTASINQLAAVYVKWGTERPEAWHLPTFQTMKMALAETFPCSGR